MNLTRIMLSASVVLAISALVGLPINAESPGLVPTRLASGKLTSAEPPFDHLFQSDFSHVQLVADEFDFADQNDSLQSEDSENREHRSDTRSTTAEPLPEPRDRDSDQTDAVEEDFDDEESAPEQADDEDDRRRNDRIMAGIGALKKPVSQIAIRATADGAVPENCAERFSQHQSVVSIGGLGIASPDPNRYTINFFHQPLYYEQRNLERCGLGCGCLQNGVSAAWFLWNTAILPYQVGRQHCDCLVASGGDCKTSESYPLDCKLLPVDCRGLVTQAAALAGFTFLLL